MSSVSQVGAPMNTNGTMGGQAAVMLATLQAVAEQQAIAQKPLKIPDVSLFGVGRIINMQA